MAGYEPGRRGDPGPFSVGSNGLHPGSVYLWGAKSFLILCVFLHD